MIRGLSLCAGIGGLDLGVGMALGGRYCPVCYVEREAFAAAVLLARMADSSLERAPVWDDLTTFDAGRWRGAVDLVLAGFPCQPWSAAGKRKGTADERWIWPDIMRIIRECEAPLVFLENVPGLVRHGLRAVLSDLASAGFDAEWLHLSAGDIGAPHRRERVFVLAWRVSHSASVALRLLAERGPGPAQAADERDAEPRDLGEDVAHPEHDAVARFPPGPGDTEGWRRWLAAGGPEPAVRGGAHGPAHRVDRLRALGNGVVPAQAAAAFRELRMRVRG